MGTVEKPSPIAVNISGCRDAVLHSYSLYTATLVHMCARRIRWGPEAKLYSWEEIATALMNVSYYLGLCEDLPYTK